MTKLVIGFAVTDAWAAEEMNHSPKMMNMKVKNLDIFWEIVNAKRMSNSVVHNF